MIVTLPRAEWIDEIGEIPGLSMRVWDGRDALADPEGVVLVVPPEGRVAPAVQRCADLPDLRYVQVTSAGYDNAAPHMPPGVTLLNAAGVHDDTTAEMALTLLLASVRRLPDYLRQQDQGAWQRQPSLPLVESRVMVLGYGSIGREIARRLTAFKADVVAVASRARGGDEFVDAVHGVDELPELLPQVRAVILITTLTDATRGLVDADFLRRMPDGAVLVNVARGPVVVTDDLIAACASGRISAALDVTDPEPLPDGHPLWTTPNVIISPHVAGYPFTVLPEPGCRFLREQFTRLVAGEEPINAVEPS